MRTVGIICECNPFHAGHQRLISLAKEQGECCVIALMSGMFVQRGSPAIAEPHLRAELLLEGGADLVLELPFPFASAGADYFASAGVKILSQLGVEELWFGSECADLDFLKRVANVSLQSAFLEDYRKLCKSGEGTASAFRTALQKNGVESALSPNDLLGISYLRAIQKQRSKLVAHLVKREGNGYMDEMLKNQIPSASALRKSWLENGISSIKPYFSKNAFHLLEQAQADGMAPVRESYLHELAFAKFRVESKEKWDRIAELDSGLGRRIAQAAKNAKNVQEFSAQLSTKQYPDARIRRGLLFALLNVEKKTLKLEIGYLLQLGSNEIGRNFLASRRKNAILPIVTSLSKIPHTKAAILQKELSERAESLYGLCLPITVSEGTFLRKNPVLWQKEQTNREEKQ